MASKNFERVLEFVVNNDLKSARALFHNELVKMSRKIYEEQDIDDTERAFDEVHADHVDGIEDSFGGDESDDFVDDVEVEGDADSDELNPELADRVAEVESEIDALKAEFDALVNDEEEDLEDEQELDHEEADDLEDEAEDFEDAGDEAEDLSDDLESETDDEDEGLDDEDEDFEDGDEDVVDEAIIREYVEKVTKGLATSSEGEGVNSKSPVASKNEIVKGVSAKNIAQAATENGRTAPETKDLLGGQRVQNRPGSRAKLEAAPKPKK